MTSTSGTRKALRASFELDEQEAAALARLTDRYAGDLPAIQQREAVRVPAVVHAVFHHQARRLLPGFRLVRVTDDGRAGGPGRRRRRRPVPAASGARGPREPGRRTAVRG